MYNNDDYDFPRFPHKLVRQQIAECLTAWGMKADHVETSADLLIEADLRGVDTHGISMLTSYDDRRRKNMLSANAEVKVVHETPTTALIDGGGGQLGAALEKTLNEQSPNRGLVFRGLGVAIAWQVDQHEPSTQVEKVDFLGTSWGVGNTRKLSLPHQGVD